MWRVASAPCFPSPWLPTQGPEGSCECDCAPSLLRHIACLRNPLLVLSKASILLGWGGSVPPPPTPSRLSSWLCCCPHRFYSLGVSPTALPSHPRSSKSLPALSSPHTLSPCLEHCLSFHAWPTPVHLSDLSLNSFISEVSSASSPKQNKKQKQNKWYLSVISCHSTLNVCNSCRNLNMCSIYIFFLICFISVPSSDYSP